MKGSNTTPAVDLGFSYRVTSAGEVRIARGGRVVAILRAKAASKFLAKAQGASPEAVQQLLARMTGNYRRGNEGPGRV